MDYKARLIEICEIYSGQVKLNGDVYKKIAESIAFKDFLYPMWHGAQFPNPDLEFVKFVILTNAINFCTFANTNRNLVSGCYRLSLNCDCSSVYYGSEAIAMAFKIALKRKLIEFNFGYFASDSFDENVFNKIFTDISPRMEFRTERFGMLKNFCKEIIKEYGTVWELFGAADWKIAGENGFISRLSRLTGYSGDELFFNKRAVLCAYMIHARGLHSDNKFLQFTDINLLPPLSDAHIFNFMAEEQILFVEPNLMHRLAVGQIFDESREEDLAIVNSMRAHGAYGIILLLEEINRLRKEKYLREISIIQLDNYIWSTSRNDSFRHYYPYILSTKI